MRTVTNLKKTVYEVDFALPEGSTALGVALWCGTHLKRKMEIDLEQNVAQFIDQDDALTFEKEWK